MSPSKNSTRDQPQLRRSQRISGYARSNNSSNSAGVAKNTTPPRSKGSRSPLESQGILQNALRSGTRLPPPDKQQQQQQQQEKKKKPAAGSPPPPPPPPPPPRYPTLSSFKHPEHGTRIVRIVHCANPVLRTSVFRGAEGQRVTRVERLPLEPGAGFPDPRARRAAGCPSAVVPGPATKRKLEHFREGGRNFVRVRLGML
ncbi:hypothetical protein RB597_003476 [Gaeumannomyces tritici]